MYVVCFLKPANGSSPPVLPGEHVDMRIGVVDGLRTAVEPTCSTSTAGTAWSASRSSSLRRLERRGQTDEYGTILDAHRPIERGTGGCRNDCGRVMRWALGGNLPRLQIVRQQVNCLDLRTVLNVHPADLRTGVDSWRDVLRPQPRRD